MSEREDNWLEVLAGKRKPAEATPHEKEAAALRRIIADEATLQKETSAGNLDGLLSRLEDEQLLVPEQSVRRPRWLAVAAAVAFVALALPLALLTVDQGPGVVVDPYTRGGVEPQAIVVEDPATSARLLAESLRAAGMVVEAYEFEGKWIVDGEIPSELARAVGRVLEQNDVDVPDSGRVLVEYAQAGASP